MSQSARENSYNKLKNLIGTDTIIKVYRKRIDSDHLDGYVVGLSDKLLLLHTLNGNVMQLNGYSAVR